MDGRFFEETYMINKAFNYFPILPVIVIIVLGSIAGPDLLLSKNFIPVYIATVVITFIPLVFGKMVVSLEGYELIISFGSLKWIKARFLLQDIASTEVVTFHPIREFGGWGIRYGKFRGERTGCYTTKGNRGVLITLTNPRKAGFTKTNLFIIGSQKPEELKSAIGK